MSHLHVQVDELRKQVEILSQNHEREIDRKDALVQVRQQLIQSEQPLSAGKLTVALPATALTLFECRQSVHWPAASYLQEAASCKTC
jgi:hypothetical protein